MRKASQTWLGKLVVGFLFGLLILAFGIWGIADIFKGYGRAAVATVGKTEISADAVRTAYQTAVQTFSQRLRQPVTPQIARALGLETTVLNELVTEAALDDRMRALGLAIDDATIAKSITSDPNFRTAAGFDRAAFERLLRDNGYSEARLVGERRRFYMRRQIEESMMADVQVPLVALEAAHRLRAETRAASYAVLPVDKVKQPVPTPAEIEAYYEENKARFRSPQYRSARLLILTPATLAKPDAVSEADAKARYDKIKGERFGTPEKRAARQLVFADEAAAKAALEKIKAGESFDTAGGDVKPVDLELRAQKEFADPAVGAAAFARKLDEVGDPVAGRFGTVLVLVTKIEPEAVKPFEEVAAEVRSIIAEEAAAKQVREFQDKIEEQRAAAKPLAEIAQAVGLPVTLVESITRAGLRKDGTVFADVPEREKVLQAVFASEIGADTESITVTGGGSIWYDVTRIDIAADRPLADVKADVEARWGEEALAKAMIAKADELVTAIAGGKSIADVATAEGLTVKTADALKRDIAEGDLSAAAVTRIFGMAVGKAGQAAAADGKSRVVFVVTGANLAPMTVDAATVKMEDELRASVTRELGAQFIARAKADVGVKINQTALRTAIGGSDQ